MNKKQRNRKIIKQNKRNRIINRRYSSTIKTLSKLFFTKIKNLTFANNDVDKSKIKLDTVNVINKLYSIIDKSIKKGVIHKNTGARKKSRIGKMFIKF